MTSTATEILAMRDSKACIEARVLVITWRNGLMAFRVGTTNCQDVFTDVVSVLCNAEFDTISPSLLPSDPLKDSSFSFFSNFLRQDSITDTLVPSKAFVAQEAEQLQI